MYIIQGTPLHSAHPSYYSENFPDPGGNEEEAPKKTGLVVEHSSGDGEERGQGAIAPACLNGAIAPSLNGAMALFHLIFLFISTLALGWG